MTTADAAGGAARRLVPNAGIVIDKRFVDSMPEDGTAAIEVVTSACLASSCASNSPASVSMPRASVGSAVTSSTSRPSTMTRPPSRKLSLNWAPERRLG